MATAHTLRLFQHTICASRFALCPFACPALQSKAIIPAQSQVAVALKSLNPTLNLIYTLPKLSIFGQY